jgi:uncharacterized membrane protein YesL
VPDNPIKELYRSAMDAVLLNFLWLLASFLGLLITVGAASTALFRVAFSMLDPREPTRVLTTFIRSFKENFWTSTWVWLGVILFGIPIYFSYLIALENDQTFLLILSVVGAYQLLIFTLYAFPIIARFKTDRFTKLIKNILLIANLNLWINFKVLGSLAAVILLAVYVHSLFWLVVIGFYGLMVAFHLKPLLDRFAKPFENQEDEV